MLHTLSLLARNTKAATAIEYGLIIALVVIAMMAALVALGTVTTDIWNNVSNKVQAVS
ncbi:pilus assembly protein Flp/PilA [Sphingomonas xinjiangensis]|uniref:Pilus assembly protein Flp/PilA n=1 Tax=Sphingomonas xinjiangensis TaxID=643568 RepID=A0A840YQG3_9SPHN|nr:pilus assembly protein Flp/PilA [Sphingomonas xinjiangensis]